MTFGRKRAGNALSLTQRAALVNLGRGALPWINRAFGRKRACPSTWISFTTARALVREGLATISVSGCGSWLRLTPSGRLYAQALAGLAEAENSDLQVAVTGASRPKPSDADAARTLTGIKLG
jgi:hypothetical protein